MNTCSPKEYEIVMLGKEDQRILIDALLYDEVPNEALRSAAKQYLETLSSHDQS